MTSVTPIPLSELTTLQVGAAPERMAEARTTAELVDELRAVWARGDEWFVLGGGSNLLVGDEPFDGTVVRVLTEGISLLPSARHGHVRVRAQAGQNWDGFVAYTVAKGLSGVEALSGIPGSVGAVPVQNVGAYGQEVKETLVEVELLDESTGEVSAVAAEELGLGLRTSVLKSHYGTVPERPAVVLSATFELATVGQEEHAVRGEQLRRALGVDEDALVSVGWVREHVLAVRASKGMVLDPADADTRSAGSFFQNPVVSESVARALPPECPQWPVIPDPAAATVIPLGAYTGAVPPLPSARGEVKLAAAWLIEHAGFPRGFRLPRARAGLSTKHALALTNRGGATAEEVAELARLIRSRVQAEFGLLLQPEPVLVGVEL